MMMMMVMVMMMLMMMMVSFWDDSLAELALIAFSLCRSPQSQSGPSRQQMGLPHEDCRAKTFPWL